MHSFLRRSAAPALTALALISSVARASDREIVVCLAPRANGATPAALASDASRLAARFAALGLRVTSALSDGLPAAALAPAGRGGKSNPFDLDASHVFLLEARDAGGAQAVLDSLAADPAVAWAERNATRKPAVEWLRPPAPRLPITAPLPPGFPNDPLFNDSRQWGLRNLGPAGIFGGVAGADIHALGAWAQSVGANDVLLAVADTGIDPDQPDLAATFPDGTPRIAYAFNAAQPGQPVRDTFGHGTPVTGVMAARTNDGAHFDSLGIAGVCGGDGATNFGCRIVPIKITPDNAGEASSFTIARAILYSAAIGCRAMNLSFAGDDPSLVERAAMTRAMVSGCVVCAAIGNRGFLFGTQPQYPAAYAADGLCIGVGASDEFDQRAVFSSYGPGLDLLAPGVDIWTTFMTYPSQAGASYPGYVAAAGTSFAAPFVAGTVGLLAAERPDLDAADYPRLLMRSADDVGAPGPDSLTGAGRLNAAAALALARVRVGFWRDEVAAMSLTEISADTVRLSGDAPPAALGLRGAHVAERVEARATIAVPDSFAGPVTVWPRLGGTSTMPAGRATAAFLPWSEVVAQDAHSATLRGYLYRLLDASAEGADVWLPVPPDQARFGFTVTGPLRDPADVPAAPLGSALRLSPNPFRAGLAITGPPRERVEILDLAGRRLATLTLDGEGRARWDGRDGLGHPARAGLYFARARSGPAQRIVRLP